MNALTLPARFPLTSGWRKPLASLLTELRIDVFYPEDRVEAELAALTRRGAAVIARSDALPELQLPQHGLTVKTRCADGEHFLYVLDTVQRRVVAYVTLSRLIEVDRQVDPFLRSPHTKVASEYRRRGIATAAYRWWLDSGRCLVTGARQSPAAHALWGAMARSYRLVYVLLEGGRVRCLDGRPPAEVLDQLNCRAVLLGRNANLGDFAQEA